MADIFRGLLAQKAVEEARRVPSLYLTVDHPYLARVADQDLGRPRFALARRPQFQDPFLMQLGR